MISARERWHTLHDARARQMDAAYAAINRDSADFWNRRADRFHRATRDTAEKDPLFQHLQAAVSQESVVLDVGAGTGRFTLALAPLVRQVVAVEPNERMRGILQAEADARGLRNVQVVSTTWEEAPNDLTADVSLCSHVLYPIRAADDFVRKLHAATRERCFLTMRALHPDTITSPLWQHFHGEPRHSSPSYVDAVALLAEMGIFADVYVSAHRSNWHWDTLDDAVEEHLESLILADTPNVRDDLRAHLERFLVPTNDGRWGLPVGNLPNAVVTWRPSDWL